MTQASVQLAESPFPERASYPRIPFFAKLLIPELDRFPTEEEARRCFHEAWLTLRRVRFLERFHVLDIASLTVALLFLTGFLVYAGIRGSSGGYILSLILAVTIAQTVVRTWRLHRGFRQVLRDDLIRLGAVVCRRCGKPVDQDYPTCPHCSREWNEAPVTELLRVYFTKKERKRLAGLVHFPTLAGALRANYGAKRAFRRSSRLPWRSLYWTTIALMAGAVVVSVLNPAIVVIAVIPFVAISLLISTLEALEQVPFTRRYITARLADEGVLVCAKCNYDMAVLRDNCCPECGEQVDDTQKQAWERYVQHAEQGE